MALYRWTRAMGRGLRKTIASPRPIYHLANLKALEDSRPWEASCKLFSNADQSLVLIASAVGPFKPVVKGGVDPFGRQADKYMLFVGARERLLLFLLRKKTLAI